MGILDLTELMEIRDIAKTKASDAPSPDLRYAYERLAVASDRAAFHLDRHFSRTATRDSDNSITTTPPAESAQPTPSPDNPVDVIPDD